jgi:hypothetical protein
VYSIGFHLGGQNLSLLESKGTPQVAPLLCSPMLLRDRNLDDGMLLVTRLFNLFHWPSKWDTHYGEREKTWVCPPSLITLKLEPLSKAQLIQAQATVSLFVRSNSNQVVAITVISLAFFISHFYLCIHTLSFLKYILFYEVSFCLQNCTLYSNLKLFYLL